MTAGTEGAVHERPQLKLREKPQNLRLKPLQSPWRLNRMLFRGCAHCRAHACLWCHTDPIVNANLCCVKTCGGTLPAFRLTCLIRQRMPWHGGCPSTSRNSTGVCGAAVSATTLPSSAKLNVLAAWLATVLASSRSSLPETGDGADSLGEAGALDTSAAPSLSAAAPVLFDVLLVALKPPVAACPAVGAPAIAGLPSVSAASGSAAQAVVAASRRSCAGPVCALT